MYLLNSTRVSFCYFPYCRSWPDNVHVLQACFQLMDVARNHGIKSFVSEQNLQEVYSYLRLNLCSSSHVVRLLTLKILSCFDQPERSSSDNKVHEQYSICFLSTLRWKEIENATITVHLDLCLRKTRVGKSHQLRDVIVLEKLFFQKRFPSTLKRKFLLFGKRLRKALFL